MVQPEIFASLDIGTTSIKVVVAEYVNQQINVIGVGHERSQGLSRGVIVDIDKTVESIKRAIKKAEQKANYTINDVIVAVPSNQVNIEPCYGMIAVSNDNREITDKDVKNVLAAAKVRSVPAEREIISVMPEEFIVDGFDNIKDPRGMIGVRLELYASLVTGPKTLVHNIRRCVAMAGLNIRDLVVQSYANAYAAMSKSEREFGTILIDMGGGQTSVSVFHDDQLKFATVDHEGGELVTKDISTILNTSIENAEQIKLEYGYALPKDTSDSEFFPVETIGKVNPERVSEHYLAEIIEARERQIFETLKKPLDKIEAFALPGGIIVTGGAASLPGVLDLAEEVFGHEVRYYIPEYVGLRNPVFTTAVGLIQYVAQLDDIHHLAQDNEQLVQVAPTTRTSQPTAAPKEPVASTKQTESVDNYKQVNDDNANDKTSVSPSNNEQTYYEESPASQYDELNDETETGEEESPVDKIKNFFKDFFV
ncbi:cell division protein FtsA [Carnobacterium sp. PL24RED07]|uniref:cell division protein FtsA n=1 Tax=unclassified Carnobacterium TaxID=257487 RepID=UPI0011ECE8F5|nr:MULTISPECIES: cell division protein FtsA [unclassified Carnobacterium]KAF3301390.1 cell division protein FtsA [Carnobacterium sp. PL26RED25]KAF3305592.1 cell division protein FtsA [Carnobacterium sp. PL24RED07]